MCIFEVVVFLLRLSVGSLLFGSEYAVSTNEFDNGILMFEPTKKARLRSKGQRVGWWKSMEIPQEHQEQHPAQSSSKLTLYLGA